VGRFNTRFRPPPVRIGLAGGFGMREHRNADVPIRLRIDVGAGPNTTAAQQAVLPMGRTRRKKGYPPITQSILAPHQESQKAREAQKEAS
jgi:hypothetical protein